jgi:glycosyltransferase involved in cell wall biosynthesis
MQTHRRFPALIEGFARAARGDAGLRLVVLGRGTHQVAVAHEPAARSGVGERIRFPGYADPETYPSLLPAFDALLFLVPGSDGTCRAVREAQAAGVPVIAAARGLLPELIAPGESGILLADDEPATIAAAIAALRADPARRERLAAGARSFAERFDAVRAAARVRELYERLVGR